MKKMHLLKNKGITSYFNHSEVYSISTIYHTNIQSILLFSRNKYKWNINTSTLWYTQS